MQTLREYQRKRDFSKTAEPRPKKGLPADAGLFVIQKHDATRLHYDFRLAMGGVLKSWAVPKGIPFKIGERHLAVEVEDHPLDYARFEGIIPKGEYGGGTVMVWDIGRYHSYGDDPEGSWKAGKLHLVLHGKKLNGEWTLVRTRLGGDGKQQWLLMKTGEAAKPPGVRRADRSAISDRTMKQIATAHDAEWHSKDEEEPEPVEPMKSKLAKHLPEGDHWIYEVKFDGYRALALKTGKHARLLSRNGKPLNFPELAEAVAALPCQSAALDGEIVAVDEAGQMSFQLLQRREMGEPVMVRYYLFDLLNLNGESWGAKPLSQRKERLAELIREQREPLRLSVDLPGSAKQVLEAIKGQRLEGVIAKRADSRYEPGKRSGAWIKVKCANEQEFVVGGYTAPQGSRSYFGALLLGYYEGEKLCYAGKVGTGFDEKWLAALYREFQPLVIAQCPFSDLPTRTSGRWNQGVTPSAMKRCTWLKPEKVAQVRFTEWTRDGNIRHPVFLGMREDKVVREVIKET